MQVPKQIYIFQSMTSICASRSLRQTSFFENTVKSLKRSPVCRKIRKRVVEPILNYCKIFNHSFIFHNVPDTSRNSGLMSTTLKSGHRSTNTLTGSALCPVLLSWTIHPYTCIYPGPGQSIKNIKQDKIKGLQSMRRKWRRLLLPLTVELHVKHYMKFCIFQY